MISLIFWILAAICKAVADNLFHHFYKSVFNSPKLNKRFWDPIQSNRNPIWLPLTKYKWDSWHVANSLMIIFAGCSAISFKFFVTPEWYSYLVALIVYGSIWNLFFNLFYNRILNKST